MRRHLLLPLVTLLAAAVPPAQAGSLGSAAAAGGSSASAGSSASSDASSASSGGRKQAAALGPYRITEVTDLAEAGGHAGQVRLQLQALTADAPAPSHVLVLPQAIARQHRLAAGQTITARVQAYGTAFVHDGSQQTFYLVLTDHFQQELAPQPVQL